MSDLINHLNDFRAMDRMHQVEHMLDHLNAAALGDVRAKLRSQDYAIRCEQHEEYHGAHPAPEPEPVTPLRQAILDAMQESFERGEQYAYACEGLSGPAAAAADWPYDRWLQEYGFKLVAEIEAAAHDE